MSDVSADRKMERDEFDRRSERFATESMNLNGMMEELADKLKRQAEEKERATTEFECAQRVLARTEGGVEEARRERASAEAKYASAKAEVASLNKKLAEALQNAAHKEAELTKLRPAMADLETRMQMLCKKRSTNEEMAKANQLAMRAEGCLEAAEKAAEKERRGHSELAHKHADLTTKTANLERRLLELESHIDVMMQGAVKVEAASGPKPRQMVTLIENLGLVEKLAAADSVDTLNLASLFFDELQRGLEEACAALKGEQTDRDSERAFACSKLRQAEQDRDRAKEDLKGYMGELRAGRDTTRTAVTAAADAAARTEAAETTVSALTAQLQTATERADALEATAVDNGRTIGRLQEANSALTEESSSLVARLPELEEAMVKLRKEKEKASELRENSQALAVAAEAARENLIRMGLESEDGRQKGLKDIERLERALYLEEAEKAEVQQQVRRVTGERDEARKLAKVNEAGKLAAMAAADKMKEEVESMARVKQAAEEALSGVQVKLNQEMLKTTQLTGKLRTRDEQIVQDGRKAKTLTRQVEAATREIEDLTSEVASRDAVIERLEAEVEQLEEELKQAGPKTLKTLKP